MSAYFPNKKYLIFFHPTNRRKALMIKKYLSREYPKVDFEIEEYPFIEKGYLIFCDQYDWERKLNEALIPNFKLTLNDQFPYKRYRAYYTEYF